MFLLQAHSVERANRPNIVFGTLLSIDQFIAKLQGKKAERVASFRVFQSNNYKVQTLKLQRAFLCCCSQIQRSQMRSHDCADVVTFSTIIETIILLKRMGQDHANIHVCSSKNSCECLDSIKTGRTTKYVARCGRFTSRWCRGTVFL